MARHRPAHVKSGFGRYTPPRRGVRPAHAAPVESSALVRRTGLIVGGGVLASAGFVGLAAVPAGAVVGSTSTNSFGGAGQCPPIVTDGPPTNNTACASTDATSPFASATSGLGGTSPFTFGNKATAKSTVVSATFADAGSGGDNFLNTASATATLFSQSQASAGSGAGSLNGLNTATANAAATAFSYAIAGVGDAAIEKKKK